MVHVGVSYVYYNPNTKNAGPDDPQFEGQLGVGILPKGHRSGHG